jgi:glycopeptide antibiotics resistance protein
VMIHLRSVLPVVLPLLAVLLWYLRTRRRFTPGRLLAVGGFAIYVLLVSKYTVFPLWFDSQYIESLRSQTSLLDGVNLVPFKGLSLKYMTSIQGWGNIVLGVPFGFLFPLVMMTTSWREIGWYSAVFAVSIETTQLAISLLYGFAYRVIDINDVLLNFAGAMIGYVLLKAVAAFYRAVSQTSLSPGADP